MVEWGLSDFGKNRVPPRSNTTRGGVHVYSEGTCNILWCFAEPSIIEGCKNDTRNKFFNKLIYIKIKSQKIIHHVLTSEFILRDPAKRLTTFRFGV